MKAVTVNPQLTTLNSRASRSLILLTLNEVEGVRALIDKLPMDRFDEVLAVDGGSTDGTVELLKSRGVAVFPQPEKGRGVAFRLGAELSQGDHLVFFSPDGNEDPRDIEPLLRKLEEGCAMAIASRFLPGARNEEDGVLLPWRAWANRAFTWIANRAFNRGPYITDTINGYRALTREAFRAMAPTSKGFMVEYEMSIRAMKLGLRVGEIPTREGDRIGGRSKAGSIPTGLAFLAFLVGEVLSGLGRPRTTGAPGPTTAVGPEGCEMAVVGLWHLGCVLAACWARLGCRVVGIDEDGERIAGLIQGKAPIHEPGLEEALKEALKAGRLRFARDLQAAGDCPFVFLAEDTPVREDDTSDLHPLQRTLERLGPHLRRGSVVIVSAQLPVGTARRLRQRLKRFDPTLELVYSPENLRLGQALACYLHPGHIILGAEDGDALERVRRLFAPMRAKILSMDLPSAEMAKHGINAFLACSIVLTNQLSDLCAAAGARAADVIAAMKQDPRIGPRAYLNAGIGFSGGTLGRDLKVLEGLSLRSGDCSPLFGCAWRYNDGRRRVVTRILKEALGDLNDRRIALWGLTYKPGTSTLRRSLPLTVARELVSEGARVPMIPRPSETRRPGRRA